MMVEWHSVVMVYSIVYWIVSRVLEILEIYYSHNKLPITDASAPLFVRQMVRSDVPFHPHLPFE